ncbi:DUF4339 domain-containing protein [Siminovitchia acidinfaciens]|uniref:DUF4339 domain-containing protein n=1 Tax=Siminovitchia acidinfaciens TaxID=2321395 RepID=A0A429XUK8_9BACI|nr:GYF domain-containing protein [Siminovitchia acidinfaciens]RST71815.1 DUF4339 domain-containing protein [Siminovitchia acidinfaciens]
MSLEQVIFDACQQRESENFFVGENIPQRKLQNVFKEYPISSDEQIFALVDTTVFGSAKQGAVLTNMGIHVKNSWTGDVREGFINWHDFQYAEFSHTNRFSSKELWIDNLQIEMSGSSLTPPIFLQTLSYIQQCIHNYYDQRGQQQANSHHPAAPPLPGLETWMVAVDGEQYGPYDEQTIKGMIQSGQISGTKDYVWKQGMDNWALIKDSAPFSSYVAPAPPPASPAFQEQPATDEQYKEIDVNTAALGDLLSLPYITLESANALLLRREALGGAFESIEQVEEVLALSPHEFERIRPYMKVAGSQKSAFQMGGRVIDF